MSDQPQQNAVPNPNHNNRQAPDASDTAAEQADNLPLQNIKAPVKPATDTPTIPKEDAEIAQKAKNDLKKGTSN